MMMMSMECSFALLCLIAGVIPGLFVQGSLRRYPPEGERFCSRRPGKTCCPGRDDQCTVPILDTVCYCDIFCNRSHGADCCPDFWAFCIGLPFLHRSTTSSSRKDKFCIHNGRQFTAGESYKINCNNCTCQRSSSIDEYNFVCSQKPCLVRPEVIDHVNRGHYGWKSSNYSFLWGLTLADGVRYRLGTFRPTATVRQMSPLRVLGTERLPRSFDWRRKSEEIVSPVLDQGNCGSSWALSSASVASDRLSVQSGTRVLLSPQQILSCNRDAVQHGCNGGHVDRAWWYMWKVGLVEDQCYPYRSGITMKTGHCKLNRISIRPGIRVKCPDGSNASTSHVHLTSPTYRIPPNEKHIMKEIMDNGPVQAIFEVKDDFFIYKSGVYRHSMPANSQPPNHLTTGFHSVKVVGWGEEETDGHQLKYWICANSWGREWGEDGYFRILRGTNECDFESFIVGVWTKPNIRKS